MGRRVGKAAPSHSRVTSEGARLPHGAMSPLRLAPSLVLAGLLASLAACRVPELLEPTAATSTLTTELNWEPLTLGPNDVVRVGVYGHPELSSPHVGVTSGGTLIDGEGNVALPLVGPVQVAGLTPTQASEVVRAAYAEFVLEPRIDFSVVEYGARRFYLYGEIREPGAYPLDRPLTLYQALSLGGGLTARADREAVVLLRGEPESLEVHVFDGDDPARKGFVAIHPEDLVFVRRSGAGRFSEEILPYLSGLSSSLGSTASILLIEERLGD